jgi:hypothetical protein
MTKKDYELIAEVFHKIHKRYPYYNARHNETVDEMANSLEEENTKFDRIRFLSACGITQENICPKYHDVILPDEEGNCSMCGDKHDGMK